MKTIRYSSQRRADRAQWSKPILMTSLLVLLALLAGGCKFKIGGDWCLEDEEVDTSTNQCVKKTDLEGQHLAGSMQAAADLRFSLSAIDSNSDFIERLNLSRAVLDDYRFRLKRQGDESEADLIPELHPDFPLCPRFPNHKTVYLGMKPGAVITLNVASRFQGPFNHFWFSIDDGTLDDGVQESGLPPLRMEQGPYLSSILPQYAENDPDWMSRGYGDTTWLTITAPLLPDGVDYYTYRINVWGQQLSYESRKRELTDEEWVDFGLIRPLTILVHVMRPIEETLHIVRVNRWDEEWQRFVPPQGGVDESSWSDEDIAHWVQHIWRLALVEFNVQFHELNSHYDLDQNGILEVADLDSTVELNVIRQELAAAGISGNVVLDVTQHGYRATLARDLAVSDTAALLNDVKCWQINPAAPLNASKSGLTYKTPRVNGGNLYRYLEIPPGDIHGHCDTTENTGRVQTTLSVLPNRLPFALPAGTPLHWLTFTSGISPAGESMSNWMIVARDNRKIPMTQSVYIKTIAHQIGHALFKIHDAYGLAFPGRVGGDHPIESEPPLHADYLMRRENDAEFEETLNDTYIGNHCALIRDWLPFHQQPWLETRENRHSVLTVNMDMSGRSLD